MRSPRCARRAHGHRAGYFTCLLRLTNARPRSTGMILATTRWQSMDRVILFRIKASPAMVRAVILTDQPGVRFPEISQNNAAIHLWATGLSPNGSSDADVGLSGQNGTLIVGPKGLVTNRVARLNSSSTPGGTDTGKTGLMAVDRGSSSQVLIYQDGSLASRAPASSCRAFRIGARRSCSSRRRPSPSPTSATGCWTAPWSRSRLTALTRAEPPPHWRTPLVSSAGSGKVSNGPGASSICR